MMKRKWKKCDYKYVNGILKNWKSNGYKTVQEIKDNDYSQSNQSSIPKELFNYDWLNDDE